MDDVDEALACILADCKNADDMERWIGKFAAIAQQLVCFMGREAHQTEAGIRTLYSTWADMATEQFAEGRRFPSKKPH